MPLMVVFYVFQLTQHVVVLIFAAILSITASSTAGSKMGVGLLAANIGGTHRAGMEELPAEHVALLTETVSADVVEAYQESRLDQNLRSRVGAIGVMQIMPIMFTVFFAFFPSGLVLYWVTNTVLSIAQQWKINKVVEQETKDRPHGKKAKSGET